MVDGSLISVVVSGIRGEADVELTDEMTVPRIQATARQLPQAFQLSQNELLRDVSFTELRSKRLVC